MSSQDLRKVLVSGARVEEEREVVFACKVELGWEESKLSRFGGMGESVVICEKGTKSGGG